MLPLRVGNVVKKPTNLIEGVAFSVRATLLSSWLPRLLRISARRLGPTNPPLQVRPAQPRRGRLSRVFAICFNDFRSSFSGV